MPLIKLFIQTKWFFSFKLLLENVYLKDTFIPVHRRKQDLNVMVVLARNLTIIMTKN